MFDEFDVKADVLKMLMEDLEDRDLEKIRSLKKLKMSSEPKIEGIKIEEGKVEKLDEDEAKEELRKSLKSPLESLLSEDEVESEDEDEESIIEKLKESPRKVNHATYYR